MDAAIHLFDNAFGRSPTIDKRLIESHPSHGVDPELVQFGLEFAAMLRSAALQHEWTRDIKGAANLLGQAIADSSGTEAEFSKLCDGSLEIMTIGSRHFVQP